MVDRPRMCGHRTRVCYGRTTRGFLFWISWAQQKFPGATETHMGWVFPPFSPVQNRTDDFSASFSPLRCSALQPPLQCTASAPAVHCIRPCKYVFFYRVCISPKTYLDSLWPIWHVFSVAQIHAQPISVGFERFWEYFWNSNGKLFLRIWSKMSESEERENVRGFVWSDPVMIR